MTDTTTDLNLTLKDIEDAVILNNRMEIRLRCIEERIKVGICTDTALLKEVMELMDGQKLILKKRAEILRENLKNRTEDILLLMETGKEAA